jgi:hypothetical protein
MGAIASGGYGGAPGAQAGSYSGGSGNQGGSDVRKILNSDGSIIARSEAREAWETSYLASCSAEWYSR